MSITQTSNKTAVKLGALAIAMFGFGYLLVPIYDVFCEITGLNGKTGILSQEEAAGGTVDENRLVTVQFDTNVNGELPWQFKASEFQMRVNPGTVNDAVFTVENTSDETIIGQAIPSVAPGQASVYFNKTECFCFTQQTLAPREKKEMLVRFVVDSELPEKISTLTLSYTFFMAPEQKNKTAGTAQATGDKNSI